MNWNRIAILISLTLLMVACSSQGGTAQQDTVAATVDPANAGLVARVNGVPITQAQFDRELERQSGPNIADPTALERQILNQLIDQELIKQGATTLGINISAADVQAEIDAQRSIAENEAAWQASLAQNNYTEEEWTQAQYDVLVTNAVRDHLLTPYFGEVEQVHAREIVVSSNEEALAILERLNNGEDFVALTMQVSIFPVIQETGGDLGWFARHELFQPELEAYAFSLEPGQIGGPIRTSLGYHIIQIIDKAVRPVEPERLPTISRNLFDDWLEQQHANASIETYIQW